MTGRDRNRIELQSDLLGAASFGIENVLALTGDHVVVGDHTQAKAVFDLESVQMLDTIAKLNGGHDLSGNELHGTPDFFPGAVVTPDAHPLPPQLAKFDKKVRAGAQYFQTQAVYDADSFKRFMEHARALRREGAGRHRGAALGADGPLHEQEHPGDQRAPVASSTSSRPPRTPRARASRSPRASSATSATPATACTSWRWAPSISSPRSSTPPNSER